MILVRNSIPYHSEKEVDRDRNISVRFFSDMNEDTFNRNSVILFNMVEQKVEHVNLVYSNKILEVKPIELLAPGTHYKLMISGGDLGVRDIVDIPMAETYSLEFYTKDTVALKAPVLIEPNHRTIVDMPFTIKLQGDEEAAYIRLQISDSHSFNKIIYPINEQLIASQVELELTPDIKLAAGTYYLRVASVDEAGIQTAFAAPIQFYTEGNFTEGDEVLTPELPEEPPVEEPIEPPVEEPEEPIEEPTEDEEPQEPIEGEEPVEGEEPERPIEDVINDEIEIPEIPEEEEEVIFKVLGLKPKQDMVHVPVTNMKTIIIRFSEDVDPDSVTMESVYVVAEKN